MVSVAMSYSDAARRIVGRTEPFAAVAGCLPDRPRVNGTERSYFADSWLPRRLTELSALIGAIRVPTHLIFPQ